MIRISDVDASLRFFCEGLGLKETWRKDSEKGRYTNYFLHAPEDKENYHSKKAPALELTYNWDPEDYTGGRNKGKKAAIEKKSQVNTRPSVVFQKSFLIDAFGQLSIKHHNTFPIMLLKQLVELIDFLVKKLIKLIKNFYFKKIIQLRGIIKNYLVY